ncbi:hypothetical protein [Bacteroides sp.]|uniref:hypothetical protein n=1 Tax=Bacteroides sp. TaxID=29523 RepID=UPI0025BC93F5|nr:hypothetical protein [Bacteroides sp.]
MNKKCFLSVLCFSIGLYSCNKENGGFEFRTDSHPRIFATSGGRVAIVDKVNNVDWAKNVYDDLKNEVDPIIAIHQNDPSYVISRMQMHWEPGKRYIRFYTDGNFVTRREGNAKYPTVRVTYGRAASNSVPLAPIDKIIPYGDGSLTKPCKESLGIVKLTEKPANTLSQLGQDIKYDTIPFTKTGLGTETVNRSFIQLAWKSSILYYITGDKKYAKLSADILWNFVRGASQQEQLNPDWEEKSKDNCINGYLSFETLGDTRHFATLPLAYDMIYNYLRDEYFESDQFVNGIEGEMWAPAHNEGKEWAMERFEIMFKRLIENKLNRGGGLKGNWNMNEQQSAMLYALALEDDNAYKDGKGRGYYVNKLVYGPTTESHGAYVDVLRANISPVTGLWPEAPGGYGQGSSEQLVRFGYIYYKNGLDLLSEDSLLNKVPGAMPQMMFPNGYITNIGDASYSIMFTSQIELMMAYAAEKGDKDRLDYWASMMKYAKKRDFNNEFYYSLFFYLPEVPKSDGLPHLSRMSYSSVYSCVFARNNADDYKDALAFTLAGFGKNMGHRQPNGMTMELYGRGHVLAPDQGIGQDYWSKDSHEYKMNVAAHNTVSPNGKGADNDMPQNLEILYSEPLIVEGGEPEQELSPNHQFVDAVNHFRTKEINAEQRRSLSIVRTSRHTGYFVDIFRSDVMDDEDKYNDYIYHNMGIGSKIYDMSGNSIKMSSESIDSLSGKGYSYFTTLGSKKLSEGFYVDFDLGVDDTHMRMFVPEGEGRTVYQLNSLFNHRYYEASLKKLPVPAILMRHDGEAWNNPFIAIYEPYGNGADGVIESVYIGDTEKQDGMAKVSVKYKNSEKKDHIMHSDKQNVKTEYMGTEFVGTYSIVSVDGNDKKSVYIVNGKSLKRDGLSVSASDGGSFDAYLEWKDSKLYYKSNKELVIHGNFEQIIKM